MQLASQVQRVTRRVHAIESVVAVERRLFFQVNDMDRGGASSSPEPGWEATTDPTASPLPSANAWLYHGSVG